MLTVFQRYSLASRWKNGNSSVSIALTVDLETPHFRYGMLKYSFFLSNKNTFPNLSNPSSSSLPYPSLSLPHRNQNSLNCIREKILRT